MLTTCGGGSMLQEFQGAVVDRWWEAGEGDGDAGWYRAEVLDLVDDLQDAPGLWCSIG